MVKRTDPKRFVAEILLFSLFYTFIGGIGLAMAMSLNTGFGFMAGCFVSIINFRLMASDSFIIGSIVPQKARKFIIGRFILRYCIMFGFIALIVTRTDWNFAAAFAGVFLVQAVMVTRHVGQIFFPRKNNL